MFSWPGPLSGFSVWDPCYLDDLLDLGTRWWTDVCVALSLHIRFTSVYGLRVFRRVFRLERLLGSHCCSETVQVASTKKTHETT